MLSNSDHETSTLTSGIQLRPSQFSSFVKTFFRDSRSNNELLFVLFSAKVHSVTKERRLLTFKCFPLEISKMLISIYNFIIVGEARHAICGIFGQLIVADYRNCCTSKKRHAKVGYLLKV